MKKFFIIACCAGMSLVSRAQKVSQPPTLPDNIKWMHISSGYPNNINVRAVRDFVKRVKPTPDAEWSSANTGFTVKYMLGDRHCRTVYNKRGEFLYTVRQYSESLMPRDVRTAVKSRYFDHSITLVEELERPTLPLTYIVHMQDATTIINVTVIDGQIEAVEDYIKG